MRVDNVQANFVLHAFNILILKVHSSQLQKMNNYSFCFLLIRSSKAVDKERKN
jgi:hypothetical protein